MRQTIAEKDRKIREQQEKIRLLEEIVELQKKLLLQPPAPQVVPYPYYPVPYYPYVPSNPVWTSTSLIADDKIYGAVDTGVWQ